MIVLGVDPGLANTGWSLIETDLISSIPDPGVTTSKPTHALTIVKAGGTIVTTPDMPLIPRIHYIREEIRKITTANKPNLAVIELPVQVGPGARTGSTLAVCTAIALDWRSTPPNWVVCFRPERLQSVAYGVRSSTGRQTIEAFKQVQPKITTRVSPHQADAYFLAYHGTRFLMTCLKKQWPTEILSEKEYRTFITAEKTHKRGPKKGQLDSTAMQTQEGEAWWCNAV